MKERKVGGLARVAIRAEVRSFTECIRATVLIVNTLLDPYPVTSLFMRREVGLTSSMPILSDNNPNRLLCGFPQNFQAVS